VSPLSREPLLSHVIIRGVKPLATDMGIEAAFLFGAWVQGSSTKR
jgi:hypothetical protein